MQVNTLQDAERIAATNGYSLTAADRKAIADRQSAELRRLTALEPPPSAGWTQRFNRWYPQFLSSLTGLGEVLMTFTQTVIISFGVPVGLLVLLVVEHQRVLHGIQLFEVDYSLAAFAAFALVFLNLILEFQIHYVESKAGYHKERDRRWSLRIAAKNWAYRLGLGNDWQEQALSPAQPYRRALRVITFTILALALSGSMRTVVETTTGTWYEAIGSILTESSLSQMMTWAGGLLFALAAVWGAQLLSRYVAMRTAEILAGMQAAAKDESPTQKYESQLDTVAADYIMSKLAQKRIKAEKQNPTPAGNVIAPPEVVMISSNGHYSVTE